MAFAKYLFLMFLYHLLDFKVDSKCPKSFQCGYLGSLEFPFSNVPGCGLLVVRDCDFGPPTLHQGPEEHEYQIERKTSTNQLSLYDPRLENFSFDGNCSSFVGLSLPQTPFVSFTFSPNLTVFTCSNQTSNEDIQDYFQNYRRVDCRTPSRFTAYYRKPTTTHVRESSIPTECSAIQLPIEPEVISGGPQLLTGFTLEWHVSEACYACYRKGGYCRTDQMNRFYCRKGNTRNWTFKKIFLIGGLTFLAAFTSTSIILFLCIKLLGLPKGKSGNEKDIELFLRNNGDLVPRRYKYSEVKKMTESFSENIGKGGYGSVYKGKLRDGRLVAVKILNESKGNGEEFMNEVASISRTSHINIVSLLGFCFKGSKRALIYDFMPNGSLDKFIQNATSSSTEGGLGWQKLFEISLGISRGLEYLHQGCNTRILHFDIKPHNILLDKDFNPRISDFGLAKLCPNRSSIVSMLGTRGTIGYIAPEVFCRNFGEVSHKSDVYSYGMMILEIAGGSKNIDPKDLDSASDIYFPQYIYRQLEMEVERGDNLDGIMNEYESQFLKRKLLIVGLWCIQTDPKNRPSITKVVEMLEGKLESLQVPPKS